MAHGIKTHRNSREDQKPTDLNELSGIWNHSRGPFCIANNVIA